MKNILSLIALLSISLSASAQFASNITWGSLPGPGGAIWQENGVNLDSLTLGYFDTTSTFQTIGTLTDGGNGLGLVFGATSASYDSSLIGQIAWVKVGTEENYLSRSSWVLSGNEAPTPPSSEDFSVGDATIDNWNAINADNWSFEFITPGGFQDIGQTINVVVPEPSTYALIAGFAAFLFVAIRRRK